MSKPLAQLSVIELARLRDALYDSYYDVEANCTIEFVIINEGVQTINCLICFG
jgi:hypothetical protein